MTLEEDADVRALPLGRVPARPAGSSIQAVERAAAVLAAFTPQRSRLSLNEITAVLGTSKATAHRYTMVLREVNLLRYDAREALYSLGPQLVSLATAARNGMPVIRAAEPFMDRLRREVGETVVLSIWDGESPVVVASHEGTEHVARVAVRVGARLSPTASAQGRVFHAHLDEESLPRLRQEVRADPEFAAELERIRATGVSVKSPLVNGLRTIAAPVFAGDAITAALAVVATSTSLADDAGSVSAALVETARQLSVELGSSRSRVVDGG